MKVDICVLIILLTIDAPGLKANNAMGGTSKQVKKDWGLGGVLVMDDAPDGKKAGTMIWGGLPNLIWVSPDSGFLVSFTSIKLWKIADLRP
jgi:hypothetical protein